MKKIYLLLSVCFCYLISCNRNSITSKRKATMMAIVNAIEENDTSQLFKLVDTSIIFNTIGKDGFKYNVNSLKTIFDKEKISVNKDDFLPVNLHSGADAFQVNIPLNEELF